MPAKNKHTNNNFDNQLLHLQADAAYGRFCEAQSLISGDYKEVLNLDAGYYMQAAGPRAAYRYAMTENNVFVRHTGNKVYELTDHLGNVRATVSDACKAMYQNGSWTSTAIVNNFNYYYPFGMLMPGLHGPANSTYRFGFNGKENDNEIKGFGNQQDYGMRIYDTRIARFLSVDPITKDYPELTPYQFASNSPIDAIDLDGLERLGIHSIEQKDGSYITTYTWLDVEIARQMYCKAMNHDYTLGREGILATIQRLDGTIETDNSRTVYDFQIAAKKAYKNNISFGARLNNLVSYGNGPANFERNYLIGHHDPAMLGKVDKQDATVGMAVIGAMSGAGVLVEAVSFGAALIASISIANNIDDALIDKNNESFSQRLVTNKSTKDIIGGFKLGINVFSLSRSVYDLEETVECSIKVINSGTDAGSIIQSSKNSVNVNNQLNQNK